MYAEFNGLLGNPPRHSNEGVRNDRCGEDAMFQWPAIVAALIGLAASGRALGQPDTDPDPVQTALSARAAPLNSPGVVEVSAYGRRGGLVGWRVVYFRAKLLEKLNAEGVHAGNSDSARVLAWSREMNTRLIGETKASLGGDVDDRALETSVSSEFCEEAPSQSGGLRFMTMVARFRGSRAIYIQNPPPGTPSTDLVPAHQVPEVEVEIRPDKPVWKPGDSITGKFMIRSVSGRSYTISFSEVPRVTVVDSKGQKPPDFPTRVFICGTPAAGAPPIVVTPRNAYEASFSIITDPLSELGGYTLAEGRYELTYPNLDTAFNIATRVKPAPIEVRAQGGPLLGSRITHLVATDDRITVLREDGSIEAHDIETGRLLAWATIADYALTGDRWTPNEVLSPDGKTLARLVRPKDDAPRLLDLYTVTDEGGSVRHIPLDWVKSYSSALIRAFTPDGGSVLVGSDSTLVRYRIDDLSQASIDGKRFPEFTPTGQIVTTEPEAFVVRSATDGSIKRIEAPLSTDYCAKLLGVHGIYAGESPFSSKPKSRGVVFVSYDGERRIKLDSVPTIPVCESRDGALVALRQKSLYDIRSQHTSDAVEVWCVAEAKRLYRLEGDKFRVPSFSGRFLVCPVIIQGDSNVTWFDERAELRDATTGNFVRTLDLGGGH